MLSYLSRRFEKAEKLPKAVYLAADAAVALLFSLTMFFCSIVEVSEALAIFGCFTALTILLKFSRCLLKGCIGGYAAALFISLILFFNTDLFLDSSLHPAVHILQFLCCFVVMAYIVYIYSDILSERKADKKQLLKALLSAAALMFTVFIYLPTDTFINNRKEFDFRYQDFIFWELLLFFIGAVIVGALAAPLVRKVFNVLMSLLLILNLGVYAQYMFMNGELPLIMGEEVDWSAYTGITIISAAGWCVIIAGTIILQLKAFKVWEKVSVAAPMFIFGTELLTAVFLLVTADAAAFEYSCYALSAKEQFVVSGKKNVITLIFDTCDNRDLNEIFRDSPEEFEGLEDFTLYNNTCSSFTVTNGSLTVLLNGYEEPAENYIYYNEWYKKAWHTERSNSFYNRLHEANYKVNYFIQYDLEADDAEGKVDNFEYCTREPLMLISKRCMKDMNALAAYRYMPYILKRFSRVCDSVSIRVFGIPFDPNSGIQFSDDKISRNREYKEKLHLGLPENEADKDKNYFIIDHLDGTHEPIESGDAVTETKLCLSIVKEYVRQLKELGVYDDSVIIMTSDHGSHTTTSPTPIFMIKEAGAHSDEMRISSAPIHHRDLLATYLKAAGLHNGEADSELFGPSIYDISEDDIRPRMVYFYDCYIKETYKVEYTGNSDDLKNEIENKHFLGTIKFK